MITLIIAFRFSGSKKQLVKALLFCLAIDFFLIMSCLPANAQDKKQCAGITKSGTQCSRKADSVYCSQHNPLTPKCSETAKSTGKRCTRPVKKEGDKCFQHNKSTAYLYNAYSPEYDESFVIKSFIHLRNDTLVHFDNNAVATIKKTPYTARIISLYIK